MADWLLLRLLTAWRFSPSGKVDAIDFRIVDHPGMVCWQSVELDREIISHNYGSF